MSLKDKKIVLGVGGGIAAYKACELLRRLQDRGAEVHVILTPAAQKFITPLSFQALSKHPVHTDLFNLTEESQMGHIELADSADALVLAPATADLLAKLAHGMADDLLCTTVLVTRAPIFLAPSMNVNMWEKTVVQKNLQKLRERGMWIVDPETGSLACGWEGQGRLAEPQNIVEVIERYFSQQNLHQHSTLRGKRVLINAGPTREYLDPVRFLSNPSTGKMGFALARAAQNRGAQVTLVAGPVTLATPHQVKRIDVVSAQEMLEACQQEFADSDIFIATAAVGDYCPNEHHPHKLKKKNETLHLQLQPTTDILATLSKLKKNNQLLVGFAAETHRLEEYAKTKLLAKKLDLIVANDVTRPESGFAADTNEIFLMGKDGVIEKHPLMSKQEAAEEILNRVEELLNQPASMQSIGNEG